MPIVKIAARTILAAKSSNTFRVSLNSFPLKNKPAEFQTISHIFAISGVYSSYHKAKTMAPRTIPGSTGMAEYMLPIMAASL